VIPSRHITAHVRDPAQEKPFINQAGIELLGYPATTAGSV